MKRKFKKNWIKMNEDSKDQVTEVITEKEEEKMSFFAKHKKGLIIGGLGALAAGAAGIFLASKKGSDDEDEDYDLEDFEDAELEELAASEEETEG